MVLAWGLLTASLALIALNPGVPSVNYALLWLALMAVARAVALIVPSFAVGIDLSLLFVCFIGLEIGGLFLVPCLLAFALADGVGVEQAKLTGPGGSLIRFQWDTETRREARDLRRRCYVGRPQMTPPTTPYRR